ncbi:MAG: hypothetical protein APF77_00205 [Clostridia bacterium BRH_c25]|nr:MAG: hypothetical protein APF77_00205 [Clostridia bacterium BRH_c25]
MSFLSGFIKGLFIGIGAVAPGLSGGALAVIFGLYERITDAIADVFKNFRRNALFFFPVVLGGGVGVLAFSRIMEYVFLNYEVQVKYLFVGLMIGTLPSVFRQANRKGFKKKYILPCIIAFSMTLLFIILENGSINIIPEVNHGLLQLATYGAIIGIGTIVPGISASFVLMYIGAYQIVLEGIARIDPAVLIPVGIGFLASIIVFAKLVSFLFKRFYGYTYYAVLGFVIGSIIAIFPGIAFNVKYLISLMLFVSGFYLSLTLSSYAK